MNPGTHPQSRRKVDLVVHDLSNYDIIRRTYSGKKYALQASRLGPHLRMKRDRLPCSLAVNVAELPAFAQLLNSG